MRIALMIGLVMATLYSAYAVLLYLGAGPAVFARHGTSLLPVIVTYYVAGSVGGAAVGMLLPLTRYLLGQLVVGVVVASIVFFCITVAAQGPPSSWRDEDWEGLLVLSLVTGIPGSILWRKVVSRR